MHLGERVYRLDAFHGVTAEELLRWRRNFSLREPTIEELFYRMGSPLYLENIEVQLTDLQSGASLVRSVSITPHH